MNLAEFLLQRIGEDEAAARAATPGPWEWDEDVEELRAPNVQMPLLDGRTYAAAVICALGYDDSGSLLIETADAEHIARHDPARALAECAAKRAIVGWYESLSERVEAVPALEPRQNELGMALRALAAVYSDHLEYRADWAL